MRKHIDKLAIDLGTHFSGLAMSMRQPAGRLFATTVDAKALQEERHRKGRRWEITLEEIVSFFAWQPRLVLVERGPLHDQEFLCLMGALKQAAEETQTRIEFVHAKTWRKTLHGSANVNPETRLTWLESMLPQSFNEADVVAALTIDPTEHVYDALGLLCYESTVERLIGKKDSGARGKHRIAALGNEGLRYHREVVDLSPDLRKAIGKAVDHVREKQRRVELLFWALYWTAYYGLRPGVLAIARAARCSRVSLRVYMQVLESCGVLKMSTDGPALFPRTAYLTLRFEEAKHEAYKEQWVLPARW